MIQKDFEQEKYKKIVHKITQLLQTVPPLNESEFKDFSMLVSNLLIYDYKKVSNQNVLIKLLAKMVLAQWALNKNTRLINLLIDELDKRFQNNVFQVHLNILNFLILIFSDEALPLDVANKRKAFDFLLNKSSAVFLDQEITFLFFVLLNRVISSNQNDFEGVKSMLFLIKKEKALQIQDP